MAYRVEYTEVTSTYTRRHGTGAFDSRAEAEAAVPRRPAPPRVEAHPFVAQESRADAGVVGASSTGETITEGTVWARLVCVFIDPVAEQPEEGPPILMRVLAACARPECVLGEGFAQRVRCEAPGLLRAKAGRLRRRCASEGVLESALILRAAASFAEIAPLSLAPGYFKHRVQELKAEAATARSAAPSTSDQAPREPGATPSGDGLSF